MPLEPRKVLVTGSDGFIGSHLAERLVRDGHDVRAFVQYNSFDSHGWLDAVPPETHRALHVVAGDIRDPRVVHDAVKDREVVFHLAALIAIPYSYRAPRSYVETNVLGTLHVLEAARELGVSRVVHTSTSEVYGTARRVPIDEDHPLSAQSPYAASKIAADQMALAFHRSYGVPVSVIRPFNTYGPRQSLRALIPSVIVQLLRGDGTVSLGNVRPTRDFNYVDDTVEGFLAVAGSDASVGEVVNVGSGFEVTVRRTSEILAEIIGRRLRLDVDENRMRPEDSDVERLLASHEKATRLTGWRPRFADEDGLRRGLSATVEWFARAENLARYPDRAYAL
jgi:dTDP-glucose 4,6-dehydratase